MPGSASNQIAACLIQCFKVFRMLHWQKNHARKAYPAPAACPQFSYCWARRRTVRTAHQTTQLEYLLQEPRLLFAHTQQAKTVDVKVHQLPHIEKRENFAIGQLVRDRFAPVVWIWTPARPLFETVPAPKACQTFFNPNGAAKILPPGYDGSMAVG